MSRHRCSGAYAGPYFTADGKGFDRHKRGCNGFGGRLARHRKPAVCVEFGAGRHVYGKVAGTESKDLLLLSRRRILIDGFGGSKVKTIIIPSITKTQRSSELDSRRQLTRRSV